MAAPPPVSVILPVYNAAASLLQAVESIRQQSFPDFECLAIDDGSTDASREILADLADRDRRIRVIHQEHSGICAALNAGLREAQGLCIARMDADDFAHTDRLARQRLVLEEDATIGLVGCRVVFGGDRETQAGYARYVDWTNDLLSPQDIALNRFVESPLPHPSVMFRSNLIDTYGGYQAGDFPEDYDCWLRWLEAGVRMTKVDAALLTWNDPPERLSRVDPRYRPEAFYAHKAAFLARWLKQLNPHHPSVYIWGAGRIARQRAAHLLKYGIRFAAYVDIAPRKTGQVLNGIPVISPEQLPGSDEAFVIPYVAKRGARAQIESWLAERGFLAGQSRISAA